MTRATVCGASLSIAAAALGLEAVDERPDLVLVDLSDPVAVARAAEIGAEIPRVAVADPTQHALLRAAGASVALARSSEPAVLGPLISSAVPARPRPATRLLVVTSIGGGVGRTLLVANLAARLAARSSVLVVDATGSGAASWWLRLAAAPWSDLEGLVDELTVEHLAIVAAERDRLRVVGGAAAMPSLPLLLASARAAVSLADLVIVDAPALPDERAIALREIADRCIVLARDDPASAPALGEVVDERIWLLASRSREPVLHGHQTLRAIPDDPPAVTAASRGPDAVGGALGRAYDDLAELVAIDSE